MITPTLPELQHISLVWPRIPALRALRALRLADIKQPDMIHLTEQDYKTIAEAIRRREEITRVFECGQYFSQDELHLTLQGHEMLVVYTYYAEGGTEEDRHGYPDYGEKIEHVDLEDVTADVTVVCDGEYDTDFDEMKLQSYFK